uniref:DNA endonuclease activator Ctp1 C-terminal domain-containing protein n=1 Tax=Romanomermis culicivorax TaxID=13658 RepID=A0A915ISH0_ROMCU
MRNNLKEQNWLSVRRAKRVQQATLDGYIRVRPAKEQSSTLTNFLLAKQSHEKEVQEIAVLPKSVSIPDSQTTTPSSISPANTPSKEQLPAVITLSSSQSYTLPPSPEELASGEASNFNTLPEMSNVIITSVENTKSPHRSCSSVPTTNGNVPKEKILASSSPARQSLSDITTGNLSLNDSLFNDSYDIPVKLNEDRKFAFKADPTRKKDERKKLCGHACHCCKAYFDALELSPEEKERRINAVSRHRDFQAPPSTPDHFWEVGFPSTAEITERKKQYYGDTTTSTSLAKNPRNKLYSRRKLS